MAEYDPPKVTDITPEEAQDKLQQNSCFHQWKPRDYALDVCIKCGTQGSVYDPNHFKNGETIPVEQWDWR
jgi:hypothetical protein